MKYAIVDLTLEKHLMILIDTCNYLEQAGQIMLQVSKNKNPEFINPRFRLTYTDNEGFHHSVELLPKRVG